MSLYVCCLVTCDQAVLSLRKHPFLLALRRWGRFEEKGMFSQARQSFNSSLFCRLSRSRPPPFLQKQNKKKRPWLQVSYLADGSPNFSSIFYMHFKPIFFLRYAKLKLLGNFMKLSRVKYRTWLKTTVVLFFKIAYQDCDGKLQQTTF